MHTDAGLREDAHVGAPEFRGRGDRDEPIDLRGYVLTLWRYRFGIFGVALVMAGGVFAMTVTSPRMYEAESSLVVSRSKIGEGVGDSSSVANFIPYLSNRAVAARVIQESGLDKPPHNLKASDLFERVLSVEEVRNSSLLLIRGRLSDPVLVATVVNKAAQLAVETARLVSQSEATQARDDIKLQLDESANRRSDAEKRLREYRETSQIEVLRKDVDAALKQRGELLALLINTEAERSKLGRAEQELAARKRIGIVRRSIDSDPVLMESARRSGEQPSDLLGLQLRSEEINPVYDKVDEEIAKSRAALASLERQKAQMASRKLDGARLGLLTDLYVKEAELSRLEMERDLTRKIYLDVATSYETARLVVAGRSAALQIVSQATPADRPLSRHVVRSTAIAFLAGLLFASVLALLHAALMAATSVQSTSRPA